MKKIQAVFASVVVLFAMAASLPAMAKAQSAVDNITVANGGTWVASSTQQVGYPFVQFSAHLIKGHSVQIELQDSNGIRYTIGLVTVPKPQVTLTGLVDLRGVATRPGDYTLLLIDLTTNTQYPAAADPQVAIKIVSPS